MLADDAPDYPMVIPVKFRLDGPLDREILEAAFQETLELSPLMTAKVEERGHKLYWIKTEPEKLIWDAPVPNLVRINLFEGNGVRVFINASAEKAAGTLFIHHSVTDGSGLCEFFETWFKIYRLRHESSNSAESDASEIPRLSELQQQRASENARLGQRGKFGMNFFKYLLRPFQEFCGLIGTLEYFSHRPTPVGASSSQLPDLETLRKQEKKLTDDHKIELSHRQTCLEFSQEETRNILKIAKRTNYKVNDMMVACMQDACQKWLANHRPDDAHLPIRIMIPMDMRSKKNREKYVANNVSMVFLDRRPGRYKSVQHLCWYGWLEMTPIKLMKLGLTFAHLIRFYRRRNKLDKLFRRDRCIATTILSNMGPLFTKSELVNDQSQLAAGELTLSELQIYPPVRPFTWLTSLVLTYGKKFVVNSSWCSRHMTSHDVDEILAQFKHNLLSGFSADPQEAATES